MKTETGKLIKTVSAIYNTYTDFDLQIILKEYNEENETNYKLEDIKDIWIKWNIIYLEMNNEKEIQYEGILSETDCKRPDKIEYNCFGSEIDN